MIYLYRVVQKTFTILKIEQLLNKDKVQEMFSFNCIYFNYCQFSRSLEYDNCIIYSAEE